MIDEYTESFIVRDANNQGGGKQHATIAAERVSGHF